MGFNSIFSENVKGQITFGMVQSLEAIVRESDLPLMTTLEKLLQNISPEARLPAIKNLLRKVKKYAERNCDMDRIIQDLYPIQNTFEENKIGPTCQKAGLDKLGLDHHPSVDGTVILTEMMVAEIEDNRTKGGFSIEDGCRWLRNVPGCEVKIFASVIAFINA